MSETTKPTRGGARRNAGRKTELSPGKTVKQTTVMLDEMTKRKAVALGEGERSRGLRFAVDVAYDLYQAGKLKLPSEKT